MSWRQGPRKLDWRPRPVFSKARMVFRGAPVGAVLVCTRKGVNTAVETPERNRRKDHRCWWWGSISERSCITLRWVDRAEAVVEATAFAENAAGYQELFALLARAGARGGEDLPLAAARSWRGN